MYQIEEQVPAQNIEMRACSDEAMRMFQVGEFQRTKIVTIQQPPCDNKEPCGSSSSSNNNNNDNNNLKKGKRLLKKYQGRHRASIVGTANTMEIQPASPSSKKVSGRKSSKRLGDIRTVLRCPGRRDSIY